MKKTKLQKFGRIVYSLVGLTGLIALIYMIFNLSTFFTTMGFWGALGYIVLMIGGLNWGIKSIFNKDLFRN